MSIATAYGAAARLAKAARAPFRRRREIRRLRPLAACAAGLLALCGAAPAQARALRLLTLGDSLTAGFGLPHDEAFEVQLQAALRAAGHDVTVLDGGVSGDTTASAKARLDWALADGPDCVLVELGGNDGLRGLDPKDTEANLDAILDTLAAHHLPVLVTGMEAPPNLGAPYADAFRAVFAHVSHRPGILFDPFFLAGVAADPALNQADHIHPNAEGVKRVVARLLPMVERLLGEVGS